jgi:1,4-alpha-glucan branching enzyme
MEQPAIRRYEDEHFVDTSKKVWNYTLLTDEDISNFQNGTHYRLYEKFGSHSIQVNNQWGMYFAVWAPNATSISVTGNFNDWENHVYELYARWDKSGVWEGFIPGFKLGEVYKYHIVGYDGIETDKGDPFANFWEKRPNTASITWDMYYEWKDADWMKKRKITIH